MSFSDRHPGHLDFMFQNDSQSSHKTYLTRQTDSWHLTSSDRHLRIDAFGNTIAKTHRQCWRLPNMREVELPSRRVAE